MRRLQILDDPNPQRPPSRDTSRTLAEVSNSCRRSWSGRGSRTADAPRMLFRCWRATEGFDITPAHTQDGSLFPAAYAQCPKAKAAWPQNDRPSVRKPLGNSKHEHFAHMVAKGEAPAKVYVLCIIRRVEITTDQPVGADYGFAGRWEAQWPL